MKKKSLKRRLPYFFGQHVPGSTSSGAMPELIKPEAGLQRIEITMEDILRWADDGGNMLGPGNRTAVSNFDAPEEGSNKPQYQRNKGHEDVSADNEPPSQGS